MDIRILKEALKHYSQSADCPAKDRNHVLDAVGECQATIDQILAVGDYDDIMYDVCTIASITVTDFLNLTSYDIYGKLAKKHGGRCPLSYYIHAMRRDMFLDTLTAAQLELGYNFLADLWQDNEASGEHNPDGTFKRN